MVRQKPWNEIEKGFYSAQNDQKTFFFGMTKDFDRLPTVNSELFFGELQ